MPENKPERGPTSPEDWHFLADAQDVAPPGSTPALQAEAGVERHGRFTRRVRHINWPLLLGSLIVLLITTVAIIGPNIAPRDPLEENAIIRVGDGWRIPPFKAFTPGFLLGSDQFGRDLLSRLLWAVRPTLFMVALVAIVRLLLGVAIGLGAGWSTGWVGRALDGAIGAALSVPVLMVALGAIAAVGIEVGVWAFIIGLSINGWAETARMVREQTRLVRGQLYVEAARALGAADSHIILRHVVRQIMPMVWMLFAFEISGTLMVTAALGFLGYYIGGDIWVVVEDHVARRVSGTPELGQMLATSWVRADEPWAMIAVGSAVFFAVLGFNLLGRGLRSRLSVKRMSRYAFTARMQEALSKRVTEPVGQWVATQITEPLARQMQHRAFYPTLAVSLILVTGGLIGWRLAVTRQTPGVTQAEEPVTGQLWSTERRDPHGTLWSGAIGPIAPEIEWMFQDPTGFSGGPAVSQEGIVYVTSKDGTLYALDHAGNVRWQTMLPNGAVGTPALGAEGQIYVADRSGNLSAFTAEGSLQWLFQTEADDPATSGPIVGLDGAIFYMLKGSTVQAVSSAGNGLWQTRALYNPIYSPPRLSPSGDYLYVKNTILDVKDGSLQELNTPMEVDQYIAGADGQSYLQSGHEIVEWRTDPDGSRVEPVRSTTWNYRNYTVRVFGGPTDAGVTPDQIVWLLYASNRDDTRFVWLNMSGRTIGNTHYAQRATQVIAVDHDGTTYACGTGRISGMECLALEPGSEDPIWQVTLESSGKVNGGALVPGRLYVTLEDGALYAVGRGRPMLVAEQEPQEIQPFTQAQGVAQSAELSPKSLGPDTDEVKWTFEDSAGFSSKPTVSSQGMVFVASNAGTLYALDPDGNTVWKVTLPAAPVGPPALSQAGDVYQVDQEGNLSAFTSNGELQWRFQPPESKPPTVGAVVGPAGTIFYTIGNNVQAVSSSGNGLWQTQAATFRNYTPLQLSPTGELLFFAEDVFDATDGTRLELESPVEVDQFFSGRDGQIYARSQHTPMQVQLIAPSIQIIQSAQWNYQDLVYTDSAPTDIGVTNQGVIWLMYTTPWGGAGSTTLAWVDLEGQIIGTAIPSGRFNAGQIVGVRDNDETAYICGFKDRPQGYSPATVQCSAFTPTSEGALWHVELDKSQEIVGGTLAPGRLYLATTEGRLYAIGEGQPLDVDNPQTGTAVPKDAESKTLGPPAAEVAWIFDDPAGFSGGPAASPDGTVYIASREGAFYALDAAGNMLWQAALPAGPVGPPALSTTGDIYQADKSGNLSCFAPDGNLHWRFQPPESKPSSVGPLVGPNGTIYYTVGASVQAVSASGEGLWQTRSRTFRTLTPLQLDAKGDLLFYADDAFATKDGTLLELEVLVNPDQYIAGNDGHLYLRAKQTVIQWQLDGSTVEVLQTAQWDYTQFVGRNFPPEEAGVTQESVVWLSYWEGTRIAWIDLAGQVLGAVHSQLGEGRLITVLDQDATAFVCGLEHPNSSRANPQCKAFNPGTEEPIWQVSLESGAEQSELGEIKGGALVPGRLYVSTEAGLLYAIGEGAALANAVSKKPSGDLETQQPAVPAAQSGVEAEGEQAIPAPPEPTPSSAAFPPSRTLRTLHSLSSVISGGTLTYTIPIINRGPSDASGVVVTDTLPSDMSLVSATSSQGAGCGASGATVVCELGTLPKGASATITIVLTVDPATTGTVTHTATVASRVADPDTLDNQLDRSTLVKRAPDLAIIQLDAPDPTIAGQPLTYTLNLVNKGPGDATGVTIKSVPPTGTSFVSATSEQELDCTASNGTVICELGDLPNAASATVVIRVAVDPSSTGIVVHSVTVAASEPDANPLDNAAVKETTINAEADLTITR
jgi:peptide/nickel transport system permease protein